MPYPADPITEPNARARSPQVASQTKFMHQYRVASPIEISAASGGAAFTLASACHGATGDVHVFAIGSGGKVWDIYPDPTSPAGYAKVDTGLTGTTIAAKTEPRGLQVWAALGSTFAACTLRDRWLGPNQPLPNPVAPNQTIARIVLNSNAPGDPNPGMALIAYQNGDDSSDPLIYTNVGNPFGMGWTTFTPRFAALPRQQMRPGAAAFYLPHGATDSHPDLVVGSPTAQPAQSYNVNYHTSGTVGDACALVSLDNVPNLNNFDNLFGVQGGGGSGGNLVRLRQSDQKWQVLTTNRNFITVQVCADGDNLIHAFMLTEGTAEHPGALYHLAPNAASPIGYADPVRIYSNVTSFTVPKNNGGTVEVFAIDAVSHDLIHLIWEPTVSSWQKPLPIALPSDQKKDVQEYISYSTDVSFRDAAGAPLVNTPVTVWASDPTILSVNGVTQPVDAHRKVSLTTNSAGQLSITQETDSLGVPALKFTMPALMGAEEIGTIEQYADGPQSVESRLKGVTTDGLKNAKDRGGRFLLKEAVRDDAGSLGALQSSFQNLMNLPDREKQRAGTRHALLARQGPSDGVHLGSPEEAHDRLRVTPRDDLPNWALAHEGDRVVYRALTDQEARARLAGIEEQLAAGGFREWWGSLGDFIRGVADGFVSAVEWVVQGVRRVLTFVVDGVKYVFDRVVEWVQEAFEMIEAILVAVVDRVNEFFQKTFEWLGFLFDWPDILRTHEVLAYTITEMFKFYRDGTPGLKRKIDGGFGDLRKWLSGALDDAIRSYDATATFGSTEKAHDRQDPEVAAAVANNPVYNGMVNNGFSTGQKGAGWQLAAPMSVGAADLDPIFTTFAEFASRTERTPAYGRVWAHVNGATGSPNQLYSLNVKRLLELVKDLLLAMLEGAQAAVDKLLDAAQRLIGKVLDFITKPLEIPFVSPLYAWMTTSESQPNGAKLTIVDVAALVAAIPTTIFYKAIRGVAPFPDPGSVEAFKREFTAESLLRASGLWTGVSGPVGDQAVVAISAKNRVALQIAGGAMTMIDGALSAQLDLWSTFPFGESLDQVYRVFSAVTYVLETGMQASSCPLITSSVFDLNAGTWAVQWLGWLVNTGFIFLTGRYPENVISSKELTTVGVLLATLYGGACFVLRSVALKGQERALGAWASWLSTVPQCAKFLLCPGIARMTYALPALAGIDVIFGGISGTLQLIDVK